MKNLDQILTDNYLKWIYESFEPKFKNGFICSESVSLTSFYENLIRIRKDDYFKNILNESISEINFGQKLTSKINSIISSGRFNHFDFQKYISHQWKFYDLINENLPDLYVYKFDFLNFKTFQKIMIHHFPEMKKDIFSEENRILFNLNFSKICGAVSYCHDFILMFLNENEEFHYDKITIDHELCHYFQYALNINANDFSMEKKIHELPDLFLTKDKIFYCISEKEFKPHILIDFANQMKKLYHLKFKNIFTFEEFLNWLFSVIEKDPLKIFKTKLGIDYKSLFKDVLPLSIVCACCHFNIQYKYIKEKIHQIYD